MKINFKLFAIVSIALSVFALSSCNAAKGGDGYYVAQNGGANLNGTADFDTSGESYTEIVENDFVNTGENASSYFSIDANTAAYPNIRNMIKGGYEIPKDAVRVEEMLNYFDYDYPSPEGEDILSMTASVFDNPYNPETKLLTVGLSAKDVEFSSVKNNLVFLIDVSGSMYSANKLPLVQQAFMLLSEGLNPEDRVSIVTYAGDDSIALEGAFGYEKQKIMAVIEDLAAGGSTAGCEGIKTAYEIAEKYFISGGNNRVILATDGDFNVGINTTDALADFISEKRESGVYFSVYGFGRGNNRSDIMETLALNGNGAYGYIDSVKEARRALVSEIGGSMVTVAKDVKAGITFNPEIVSSYRLIGYENKLLTEEEFENSETDAGELGSGHNVTVVYEIKLTDKVMSNGDKIADVLIKYKTADGTDMNRECSYPITCAHISGTLSDNDKFISSVIEFALILRESEHRANADINSLISRLESIDLSGDEFRAEFLELCKTYREKPIGE